MKKGSERRRQSKSCCLRRKETSRSSGRSAMSIVETVLQPHKQERHAYAVRSAPAPSISAFFILPSAFPSQTPELSHSPLIGRQTCRSCWSLDGFWGGSVATNMPLLRSCFAQVLFLETARNEILSGSGCPWQRRENRLASAAGEQDGSGVHHTTAANGSQDVSFGPALPARPGA